MEKLIDSNFASGMLPGGHAVKIHAKFHFNRFMVTLTFDIRTCEPRLGERLKRPGLIGISKRLSKQ